MTREEIAHKVADLIDEKGLEFGTGRFRDIELVLALAATVCRKQGEPFPTERENDTIDNIGAKS